MRHGRAFTLIELLVTVSILALLISILLPALSVARDAARHARSLSAMRQVMLGYTRYQHEHDDRVPLGYCPAVVDGVPLSVRLRSGHVLPAPGFGSLPVSRYPVRLVPYVEHAWEVLYDHTAPPEEPQPGDSDADVWMKAYLLSTNPAFGINSVYVGGDINHGGFGPGPDFPRNLNRHVVFAGAEVKRPSRLLVFSDSRLVGGGVYADGAGYHLATPPVAHGRKWRATDRGFELLSGGAVGLPEGRYVGGAATGFFDGHAATLRPRELDDMTLWSNKATAANEDH